jgi:hypothetical protein
MRCFFYVERDILPDHPSRTQEKPLRETIQANHGHFTCTERLHDLWLILWLSGSRNAVRWSNILPQKRSWTNPGPTSSAPSFSQANAPIIVIRRPSRLLDVRMADDDVHLILATVRGAFDRPDLLRQAHALLAIVVLVANIGVLASPVEGKRRYMWLYWLKVTGRSLKNWRSCI